MSYEIDYSAIGMRVRAARQKKNMKQEELANAADLSASYVSGIETGRTKLALPTLITIAHILDTTVDTLLYDNTPVLVTAYDAEAKEILDDCSAEERDFLVSMLRHAKDELRQKGLSQKTSRK
ncbi:MAG: helix-turn-helix transcriptional regulator [Lachnospiraceae bacterium]|nr:helix-turn-helix transcriptional regulator [Lachnospiraceae bacterium]